MLRRIHSHIICVVRVSFNQNHEQFWTSCGIKCTCTGLYSVCFSIIKPILKRDLKYLEYMAVTGYDLDKKENILQLLSCTDLPKIVDVENFQIPVTFLTNVFGFFTEIIEQNQRDLAKRASQWKYMTIYYFLREEYV